MKNYYESSEYDFEEEKKNLKTMEGPVRMVDGFGNLLGVLRLNVFPISDHSRFYAMASILEEHEKIPIEVNQREDRGWSCMDNMRTIHVDGIYPHESLYALSEIFIQEVSK